MKLSSFLQCSVIIILTLGAIETGCSKSRGTPLTPLIIPTPTPTATGFLTSTPTATTTSVYTNTPLPTITITATTDPGTLTPTPTITYTETPTFTPTPSSTATFVYTATPTNTGCASVNFSNIYGPAPPSVGAAGTTIVNFYLQSVRPDASCSAAEPSIYSIPFTFSTTGNLDTQITQVQLIAEGVTYTSAFSLSGVTFTGTPLGIVGDTFTLQLVMSPTASGTVQTTCNSYTISGSGIAGFSPFGGTMTGPLLTVP